MSHIYKDGKEYGGYHATVASEVSFSPGLTGMEARNIQDAIIELAEKTIKLEHLLDKKQYTFITSDHKKELQDILIQQSRLGGFSTFSINGYSGQTITSTDGKVSFVLFSTTDNKAYTGSFDTLHTDQPFHLYQATIDSTDIWNTSEFPFQ